MNKLYIITLIIFLPLISFSQSDKELVESTVSKSVIEGHIYFLASDELKGRETGEPGGDIAAKYLATTLRRYGVKPLKEAEDGYYQKIKFQKITNSPKATVEIDNIVYNRALTIVAGKIDEGGEPIFVNYGLQEDYDSEINYTNKILIAKVGKPGKLDEKKIVDVARKKQELAKKAGARAIIEIHDFEESIWRELEHNLKSETIRLATDDPVISDGIPHIWLNADSDLVSGKIENIQLSTSDKEVKEFYSSNVVGMVEGTDPKLKDEYIIYSAHYDHVGIGRPNAEGDSIYNGARDNAVGTVTVLSAAENIAKHPTKRSALFILFTAEEKGLLGSKYYVENPLLPLKKMVYCFNSDNASYNDVTKATIVGLNRTTAEQHIVEAAKQVGLSAINDPAPEQNLFDRSDNVHFAKKGIPAPTYSLGFTAFDREVFKYYHQPSDNPDNLDYDYLVKFFKAYTLACRYIANAEETPFWKEGDKYYEAGLKLYNK